MNSVYCFVFLLLLVSTASEALRTCVDVQSTMMACLLSSSVNLTHPHGQQDIQRMCWEVQVMLECVDEANSTCPDLPIFAENSFRMAIRDMERQFRQHCGDTEEPMVNDQPTRESCAPEDVRSKCSAIRPMDSNGETTCSTWRQFLACLETLQEDCGDQLELYDFDISQTIEYTRNVVKAECPDDHCIQVREEAERSCSEYLSDGGEFYCRHLEMYMDCLHRKLTSCPDPDLLTIVVNQFHHHCPHPGDRTCPEDLDTAAMDCSSFLLDVIPDNMASYCQASDRYFECADDLIDRCQDDQRFHAAHFAGLQQQRKYVDSLCKN